MGNKVLGPNESPELDFLVMNLADIKDFNEKKTLINKRLIDGWYVVDKFIVGDSALVIVMEHIINK